MAIAGDLAAAIDPVVLARQAGLDPDPWQADVLRSSAPRVLLNCSRQSGKSTISALLALHTALYAPASLVLLLSPSQRQSAELFRKCLDLYRGLGRPVPAQAETGLRLELEGGSRIISLPGSEATVRGFSGVRLLVIDEAARVKEFSYLAHQAIAHPEALVAGVKTASATVAPSSPSTPPCALHADAGVYGDGEDSALTSKTHAPDGDAARAARREQARAELERCDREARTAQAEAELRRARLAELRGQNDALGRYVLDQQRRLVEEEIREREEREKRQKEMMQRLHDVATMPIPRSRQDCEEALAQLDRFLDREQQAEQDRLWRETDAALTRRIYEPAFRRSWDARHPGGADKCPCDGCRAWRREPPR